MKRLTILLAVLALAAALAACASSSGTSLDLAIDQAALRMEAQVPAGTRVALISVSSPSPAFSQYVLDRLGSALVNDGKLKVVDRANLDKIRAEEGFQMSGEVSDDEAARIGQKAGAGAIVTGSLMKAGSSYRLTLKAITIERAEMVSSPQADIAADEKLLDLLAAGGGTEAPAVQAAPAAQAAAADAVARMDGGQSAMPAPASAPQPAPVQPAAPPQQSVPADMVRIQGGTFTMGSPSSEPERGDDETQHRVTVSSFYMGKYEVTIGEFRAFVNATGYKTTAETFGGMYVWIGSQWEVKADANWKNPYFSQGDSQPVTLVSWYDAVEYCNWLSRAEGLTPAYTIDKSWRDPNNQNYYGDLGTVTWNKNANGYRLPTEAEWEYACRAGTTTPFSTGNNITTSQANYNGNYPYNGNAKGTYRGTTTAVGSFQPNAWGLYDMHGNVWEWCWDWYGDYSSGAQTDPTGAASGSLRVVRGGSWNFSAQNLRGANRYNDFHPSDRLNILGFRLVRNGG